MINRVLGKCEVQSVIGSGAMGVVYRGHHRALGVPVAIKTIKQELADNNELVKRFSQEAQLAARLRHPNIVRVLDVDEEDGVHFMIMEYLEGRPLDVFHREGGLSDQRVFFSLFYALASAVGEAHSKGIVHRDIKPGNIIVGQEGKPVLTDFGIASALSQDARLTSPGILLGTPAYMSPEACRGDSKLSARSDVFSLGTIMYEVITGELPQMSDNVLEVLSRRIAEPIPPVAFFNEAVPIPLAKVVDRAVAFQAPTRFADGWELAGALSAAYHEMFPATANGSQSPVRPPAETRPLELPTEETEVIAMGSDLRYTDLQAMVAAAERASTGHGMVAIHHVDCTDVLLFKGPSLESVVRWRDGVFTSMSLEDVAAYQDPAGEAGVVDSYAVSERYFNAMQAICCNHALMEGLRMAFVDLGALLDYLRAEHSSGVLRLQLGGRLGMVLVREGAPTNLFCSAWIQPGGHPMESMTQLSSLLMRHPLTRLDYFSLEAAALQSQHLPVVEPPLEPAQAEALASFLAHALAESGKALDRAFGLGAGPILGKYFDEAAATFPALFGEIQLGENHSLRADELLELIDMLPITGRRSVVTLGFVEVLEGRIQAIRDALPNARKQKRVFKALLESWRAHRPWLVELGLAERLEPVFRMMDR